MRLKLENLGPIHQADVDLTLPLTILTGANNSGKTWVAWSIYAIMRCKKDLAVGREIVELLLASPEMKVNLEGLKARAWSELPDVLVRAIGDCFGITLGEGARVVVEGEGSSVNETRTIDLGIGSLVIKNSAVFISPWPKQVSGVVTTSEEIRVALRSITGLPEFLSEYILAFSYMPVALPAERAGISLFAREIAGRRFDIPRWTPGEYGLDNNYPWPIRDGLRDEMRRLGPVTTPFHKIADFLEKEVLGGTIQRNERGDPQFVASSGIHAMHISSSMVKSLARLVEYLRYQAQPGGMLIIDEPELNLHPDNQRAVARAIAEAVNAGLRVVLTTHSDWFLRELNRLVLANRLPVEKLVAHGLRKEQAIAPDKIGLYLMEAGDSRRLRCDAGGMDMGSIDEATNRLNDAEQQMYLALEEELP